MKNFMSFFTSHPPPSIRSGIPSVSFSIAPPMILIVRAIQWGLASLVVSAGLLSGWMGWEGRTVEDEASRYAAATERSEAFNWQLKAQLEQDQLTLSPEQIAVIQQDVGFVNQLAEKRRFSWTQLLHDLEEAFPAGTSIGKIQRDAKASTITVDGHAASMGDLQALMTRLQTRPAFRQPVLHQHQLADSTHSDGGGERTTVAFSLTVVYRWLLEKAESDDVS